MEIRQVQKQTQKLALTLQMRKSLKLLQLPLQELSTYLENEIVENPVLEAEQPTESLQEIKQDSSSAVDAPFLMAPSFNDAPYGDYPEELQKKKDFYESLITKSASLHEILLRQLRITSLPKKLKRIGELIIHHIDEKGYLNASLKEITQLANMPIHNDAETVTLDDTLQTLQLIQQFEPAGIGARSLKECLLLQLKAKGETSSLCYKICKYYLPEVAKNKTRFIARKLKVTPEKVLHAIKKISHLDPKPGQRFTTHTHLLPHSTTPDIILEKIQGKYEIIINHSGLPKLKISKKYYQLLKSEQTPLETKQYLRQRIINATALIKALSQREDTLLSVAKCILDFQRDFFEHGDRSDLKPLTLKQVAQRVNRNESTISRVANKKYIKTPFGDYKLSFFFTKSLKTEHEDISREAITAELLRFVQEENKKSPLTDSALATLLAKSGYKIARRTVAKYRLALKIPPAHRRKKKHI